MKNTALKTLLENCTAVEPAGDYTVLAEKTFQFKALRDANKSGVFGGEGKQVDMSVKAKKGTRGGVVIHCTEGRHETYIKLCEPPASKGTVRVLRCEDGAWVPCRLQDVKDKQLQTHAVAWCSVALGVSKEVRNGHRGVAAILDTAASLSSHVLAYEKAKKTAKRCREKNEEAVLALNEAHDGLQAFKKRAKTSLSEEGEGDDEKRGGDGDDDDDKDEAGGGDVGEIRILKVCRNLYRKAEKALRLYRKEKRAAKHADAENSTDYKIAKESARDAYRKSLQEIAIARKSNRSNLRRIEREDLLTTATAAPSDVSASHVFSECGSV